MASAACNVRSFSVTTWLARSVSTRPAGRPPPEALRRRHVAQGGDAEKVGGGLALAAPLVVRGIDKPPPRGRVEDHHLRPRRQRHRFVCSERQSISRACPARPAAEIIWSMMPQRTPTHSFSARCPNFAIVAASQGKPDTAANARATANSRAAEDDKPAPTGTSPAITPCQPRRG